MRRNSSYFGLASIRNRILLFALLITLVPSMTTGWLVSSMMYTTLEEKSEQKLRDVSDILARRIELWVKELRYDLQIFSNSFVIMENFAGYLEAHRKGGTDNSRLTLQIRAIETYLASVKEQYDLYDGLFVLDRNGEVVATSEGGEKRVGIDFSRNMMQQLEQSDFFIGGIHFANAASAPVALAGVPLYAGDGDHPVGVLAIETSLQALGRFLDDAASHSYGHQTLQAMLFQLADGRYFLSSSSAERLQEPVYASREAMEGLRKPRSIHYFLNHRGEEAVGVLVPLDSIGWGVVLAEESRAVFARVEEMRRRNVATISGLSLFIGLAAYWLTRQIIRPLVALTSGAQKVAAGDLDVRLPVEKKDEFGLAATVFNQMVEELGRSRAELEKLATQDVLTRLANRKKILRILADRFDYYRRYQAEFSVLMVDVDNFKRINDTHGHVAGDEVLRGIGQIFFETLRSSDSAGRYGGEEFLVVLAESDWDDAENVAERLRAAVENRRFDFEGREFSVTISVGIAKIVASDTDENELVNRADKALYRAKEAGRNRIVSQGWGGVPAGGDGER